MKLFVALFGLLSLAHLAAGCPPVYGKCSILPYDDEYNRDITNDPVDYMSSCYLRAVGENFGPADAFARRPLKLDLGDNLSDGYGIPYSFATSSTPMVPVTYGTDGCDYAEESDPGPFRISNTATIEGSTGPNGNIPPDCECDRHLISLDTDNCILYETYYTKFISGNNAANGVQTCGSSRFNLSEKLPSRPLYWTSADAAGLPIFPGLLKYDEAVSPAGITHATRFTVGRAQKAFITPASHLGQYKNTSYMPYGAKLRLKPSFDDSKYTDPAAKGMIKAWKKYGLIFADQGSNMFVSGTSDPRWTNTIEEINNKFRLYHDDFEVTQIFYKITRDFPNWNPPEATCNGVAANSNPSWKPTPPAPCGTASSSTAATTAKAVSTSTSTTTTTTTTTTTATTASAASTTKSASSTTTTTSASAQGSSSTSSSPATTSSTSASPAATSSTSASSSAPTNPPVVASSSGTTVSTSKSPTSTTAKLSSTTTSKPATTTTTSTSSTSSKPSTTSTSSTPKPSTTSSSSTSSTSSTPKSATTSTSSTPKPSTTASTTSFTSSTSSTPTSSSTTDSNSPSPTPSPSSSTSPSTEINSSDSSYVFPSLFIALAALMLKFL